MKLFKRLAATLGAYAAVVAGAAFVGSLMQDHDAGIAIAALLGIVGGPIAAFAWILTGDRP